MLEYDSMDVSEGIDFSKSNPIGRECYFALLILSCDIFYIYFKKNQWLSWLNAKALAWWALSARK